MLSSMQEFDLALLHLHVAVFDTLDLTTVKRFCLVCENFSYFSFCSWTGTIQDINQFIL